MNGSLKSVLHRKNKNINIITILFKQLKRKQGKYPTPENYLNVLEALKNHGILKFGKIKIKIDKSST